MKEKVVQLLRGEKRERDIVCVCMWVWEKLKNNWNTVHEPKGEVIKVGKCVIKIYIKI